MFTAYLEKDIFEQIVLSNDQKPHWYNILCNHAKINLNLSEEELSVEEVQGTPIFEFIMATGSRVIEASKTFFDDFNVDQQLIASKPRSVFFLSKPKSETDLMQENYGVVVQSGDDIEDGVLKGSFYKELTKGLVIESGNKLGWQELVSFELPPSNSLVVSDEYLFSNEENGENIGKHNIIKLLDALLPPKLLVPFHITIVANDQPSPPKPPKSVASCERIKNDIKEAITQLRDFEIIVEMVFTQTLHKRKIITNYLNITCDKGFSVFKVSDSKTIRDGNDFRCDRIFNRVAIEEGDTDFYSSELILNQLRQKCSSVAEFIANRGLLVNNIIVGDCNPDKTLKNRLINDI